MKAKKILAIILSAIMLIGSMATVATAEGTFEAQETNEGTLLAGQGTEGNPYIIDDVEDLILFRDSVNAGETKYNADNVYIALGANIDMADVDWSVNVGDACNVTFDGIFDGKDYTISNLKSTETAQMSDGYICTGLFGAIGGNAVVKNFTVDGAIIDTANFTGNNAAVVVGFAYEATGSVENVTVKNAEINAAKVDGTGAIVGYAYGGELTVKDCEVYNSTVEGQAYVGGIIGYAGGKAALETNKIDAVTVTANSCAAGGVAGIMLGGSVATNNVVKSVTLSSVHENWLNATGVVAGTFTGNITVKGTETDSAETIVGVLHANKPSAPLNKAEGSVNGVYYAKHDDAVKAALAASGDVIITLNADVELSEPLVINADDKITIDLNGFKINYNSTTQGEAMITNKGNLTIKDSGETGVINYNYTGAADPSYGKGNYTISNAGTLTVDGGKITIANIRQHAKYPIDNNSTTGDAVLVINGGHLYNYNTSAIRQFCNSTTNKNSVTINGGLIEGYCAIWVQNPGKNTVNGSLSITGGEIKTTASAYVNGTAELKDVSSRIYCTIAGEGGAWSEDSAVNITGGIINENVSLLKEAPATITLSEEATFNGYVTAPAAYVAQVGDVKYTDIQEAIKAAAPAGTVEILSDIVVEEWVMIAERLTIGNDDLITLVLDGLTINGNGHTLTINSIESASNGGRMFYDATNLNINDLTIELNNGTNGIGLKSGTLSGVNFIGGGYGVLPQDGDVTITGCTFKTNSTSIYFEEARDNLTVTGCTFENIDTANVILLRGNVEFTNNTIISGRTVNVVSGSPVVTGNNFGDVRLKVYNVAAATISDNEINVLAFQDDTVPQSTFTNNTLSEDAQAALDAVQKEDPVPPTTINNIDDLKAFRDAVNGGYTYKGETVTLAADIDLNNEEWTPIGGQTKYTKPDGSTATYNFEGRFDGGNHTIKNLKITMTGKSNIGFFGMTTNGSVKNLTIENADIEGRLNVGVVAGTPYTSTYANIKLIGHITVDGMSYVGGVGGKNAYADWSGITINADDTSYVKADSIENDVYYRTYVGGVVGFMGEGGHKFTNITSNIDVIGTVCDVGGIVGIAHYNNVFENCFATGDVKIIGYKDEGDNLEMGGIAGVWHNQNGTKVTFINCEFTGTLSSTNAEDVLYTGEYENNGLVGKQYSASGTGELVIINFEWMTGTDAGFYMVGDTPTGVMRFLFAADISDEVLESGIKYIKTSDISAAVSATGVQGTESAFYGDVTGIPEGTEGTYIAVAYVKTASGTYWSDAVECSPNFTKLFTEYTAQ